MHNVEPQVFLIGRTEPIEHGITAYLKHIGAPHWSTDGAGPEKLIEVMSRTCYRSFGVHLNPNLTRVREGAEPHLKNIVTVGHGSVLEHATWNFVFCDVSRVFTHELVRHRAGTAISQESLRFVRLTDLGQWLPTCVRETTDGVEIFTRAFRELEGLQLRLSQLFQLDDDSLPFDKRKEITSAMRRLAPIGLATTVGWSANLRTLRHVVELRTAPSAEEEIRLVFDKVAHIMQLEAPNAFSDLQRDAFGSWSTEHRKI